ncbi:PREDICTED: NAD(P)H-quinone oxidoreductase subunit U, chloroplastic [Nicotiana attenuata]|uniref:Nad(P)h-quinone oxidoreductase subunit u, chloroplastic n=1 Tax=Nicotiana attenuata TaxID=49451 RepID=A0A1J6L113_NICAT|nr:PREDICTED: NAD(P)H-quinone oxidoreductase subunit U, chloroplastic [Nicotiana attenuata]OIT24961.1 nad(p)h-quinone oxidoreductase subunit u, chloroplastic [Nicotiana attenuata]
MAATGATPYISSKNFLSSPTITNHSSNNIPVIISIPYFGNSTKRIRNLLIVQNSDRSDVSTETATATTNEISSVELPPGPPSIISALNVEKALLGIAITDIDHYDRLGLPRKCSYNEVPVAYKKKVEEVMNEGLEEVELNKKLERLKESYSILSTPEERRLYDWSLVRSEAPDKYKWPFEVDKTPMSTGTPPPQEPEDVEPTRLVGYFFLGWFVLAAVLSIAFNR